MLIKFELAEKIDQLKIPLGTFQYCYDPNDFEKPMDIRLVGGNDEYLDTLVPTYQQSELQTYLRNRKILVEVGPIDSWDSWAYSIYLEDAMSPFFKALPDTGDFPEFPTYEDALEAGLTKGIEFL
jgi:hypothetical protein